MIAAVSRAAELRRLALFVVGTFAWTWSFYIPIAAMGQSPYVWPWLVLLILGGMGPSLIGIAVIAASKRRRWRQTLARWFDPRRLDAVCWLVVLALLPLLYLLAIPVAGAFGVTAPGSVKLEALLVAPGLWLPTLFISFLSGPWSEEFGWRGLALEPMLARLGLVWGSIGLGVIWSLWHLPLYFMPGTWNQASGLGLSGLGNLSSAMQGCRWS